MLESRSDQSEGHRSSSGFAVKHGVVTKDESLLGFSLVGVGGEVLKFLFQFLCLSCYGGIPVSGGVWSFRLLFFLCSMGGLALWWNEDANVNILKSGKNFINTRLLIKGEANWFRTFIYGPTYVE
ncbi:hypothetical protein V6N12_037918 [Hibiscus sabdariffa]|uniref:Uncharacterized protein n=1 Tax=Hibiscus sabdariffa TaxID=183260 RepID=A0ABR2B0W6_9ROSI